MTTLDEAIEKGRRKRRIMAVGFSVSIIMLLIIYFGWLFVTKGYSFTVKPGEAAQTQRFAVRSGLGFFIDSKYYAIGSDGIVAVSADKYQTTEVEIDASSPSNIEVELQPKPAKVTLTTDPKKDDIAWLVNGELRETAATFNGDFIPGSYTVSVSHPAFEPASIAIEALIDGKIDEQIRLTPISGTISINSKPAGATVTLGGEQIGLTPLTVARVGGDYPVIVNYPGYEPVTDTVSLTVREKAPERNYRLQPVQATINVSTSPAGGALLVNGVPAQNPLSVDANKEHVIRYEKAGYIKQSQTIKLVPAERKQIAFNLAPETGEVAFAANEQSDVYISGQKQGVTPLRTRLQTLPSEVEFRKTGYRTVTTKFQPNSERVAHVTAEMLREFDARRKEGKPLFISSLGIEMNRVSPKAFTMGSPINEPNRGRNEHQLKVEFSRDVWISRHEITEAQFAAFKGSGSKTAMPVTDVSWDEAALFTNWLSEQEGLKPFYEISNGKVVGADSSSRGYRLPTEAEWEFVAKINRRADSTVYVWGSQEQLRDKQGNFADESLQGQQTFILRGYNDGFAGKAPVGSFKAERGGFYDLDGNVKEWVHDSYTLVPPNDNLVYTDYLGPVRGTEHVVKGASYKTGRMKNIRASIREGESDPAGDIGFRIARYQE